MEKEFVPYELALRMKQLGFDEPCFGKFYYNQLEIGGNWRNNDFKEDADVFISAPTFSQVFRWFRDKYNLKNWIESIEEPNHRSVIVNHYGKIFNTYKEAELACLTKLIEIVEKELIN